VCVSVCHTTVLYQNGCKWITETITPRDSPLALIGSQSRAFQQAIDEPCTVYVT